MVPEEVPVKFTHGHLLPPILNITMIGLVELSALILLSTLASLGVSQGYYLLRQSQRALSSTEVIDARLSVSPAGGKPRRRARHPLGGRLEYVVGNRWSIGHLVDGSTHGWRVAGKPPSKKETVLALNIFLLVEPVPIMIDEAAVRWVRNSEFGLEVVRLSPEALERLTDYLARSYSTAESVTTAPSALITPCRD